MSEFAASSARRHYDSVYRFVRRRVGSDHDAEDLTQEVFEAAVTALGSERLTSEPALAWLYTVAERRVIQAWRRRLDTQPFEETDMPDESLACRDVYGPRIIEAVLAALNRLPDAQRQVVVWKLFEGRSFVEIAAKSGVTEEACRQRLSRGLTQLREELTSKGVTP
jgi:RNA polymerase sigma factor (sigma-70 family)